MPPQPFSAARATSSGPPRECESDASAHLFINVTCGRPQAFSFLSSEIQCLVFTKSIECRAVGTPAPSAETQTRPAHMSSQARARALGNTGRAAARRRLASPQPLRHLPAASTSSRGSGRRVSSQPYRLQRQGLLSRHPAATCILAVGVALPVCLIAGRLGVAWCGSRPPCLPSLGSIALPVCLVARRLGVA